MIIQGLLGFIDLEIYDLKGLGKFIYLSAMNFTKVVLYVILTTLLGASLSCEKEEKTPENIFHCFIDGKRIDFINSTYSMSSDYVVNDVAGVPVLNNVIRAENDEYEISVNFIGTNTGERKGNIAIFGLDGFFASIETIDTTFNTIEIVQFNEFGGRLEGWFKGISLDTEPIRLTDGYFNIQQEPVDHLDHY